MTDRDLEQHVRDWYRDAVDEREAVPAELRDRVVAIPREAPVRLRTLRRHPGLTLLAAAAIIAGGGAIAAAGSGLLRESPVVPPMPSAAAIAPPEATTVPTVAPTRAPAIVRNGDLIVYTRSVDRNQRCGFGSTSCPVPRLWIVDTDGSRARELIPGGTKGQSFMAWSPDGSALVYAEDGKLFMVDPHGGEPQPLDTGCHPASSTTPSTCQEDSQLSVSPDGQRIVFVRGSNDADGYLTQSTLATMDLRTGVLSELTSTSASGGGGPSWSADGRQIVFSRFGTKDDGGPNPRIRDSAAVVDADGQNLHQLTPANLDADGATWSPDGAWIAFLSPVSGHDNDVYRVRPDGTDLQRLSTDASATSLSWTPDGHILSARRPAGGREAGWWVMDPDGGNETLLVGASALGLDSDAVAQSFPAIQPLGGEAIVAPPWTPAAAVAVGPPAATPTPTPVPDLGPGFAWTGTTTVADGNMPTTATLLTDGRVLVTAGCGTTAQLYDPATGSFGATGSMTAPRGGGTATRLQDGRVLFTGGYNCARGGEDGLWSSAELYDPATGTFNATGSMAVPREFHTATLLPDGRVLVAAGITGSPPPGAGAVVFASVRLVDTDRPLDTAELFDPATGTFSATGSLHVGRYNHVATALADGRVLVTGGGGEGTRSSRSAELYDPSTGTWRTTGSMATGRWLHTATLLGDGRVLVLGGRSPRDSVYRSAELFDPATGTFSDAGRMKDGRQQHTATLLPDGTVLVAGGYWSDGKHWHVLSSAERFNPQTGTFADIGSIGTPREGHTATLLADGRVLIVGGADIGSQGSVGDTTAILYQP
jgi:Tol biopolymer transport system component